MKKARLILLAALVLSLFTGVAWANNVNISVNGNFLNPDVPARIINNGTTVVPLRFVSQALGAQVGWDNATRTAIVRKGFQTSLPIDTPVSSVQDGNLKLEINGRLVTDVPLVEINGRVMVPLRFISETFGARVDWDGATSTVSIVFNEKAPASPSDRPEPLELLLNAERKLMEAGGFTFDGKGFFNLKMDVPDFNMNMTFDMDVNGSYRPPNEMYVKLSMTMPEFLGAISGEQNEKLMMEMYLKDNHVFAKEGEGPWQRMELGTAIDPFQLYQQFDPEYYAQMMKSLGITLTYGEDVVDGGRKFYVLNGKIEGAKMYEFLKDSLLLGMAQGIPEADVPQEDLQQVVEKMYKNMTGSFNYWIDAGTSSLTKARSEISITMEVEENGVRVPMNLSGSFDASYNAGVPVNMPQITDDMIAPSTN